MGLKRKGNGAGRMGSGQGTSARGRTAKWDNIRGILMLLVVLAHIYNHYTKFSPAARSLFLFVYTFHMPLFLFLSGMFGRKAVHRRDWGKIFSFFILYWVIKLITSGTNFVLFRRWNFRPLGDNGTCWYAWAVFVFMLLCIVLQLLTDKFSPEKRPAAKAAVLLLSCALACVSGRYAQIGDFLYAARVINFFPFFYLGYCTDREKLLKASDKGRVRIISAVLLAFFAWVCYAFGDRLYVFRPLLAGRYPYAALGEERAGYGWMFRLGVYALTVVISFALICVAPKRSFAFLTRRVGQRTLSVYTFHYALISLIIEKTRISQYLKVIWPEHWMLLLIPVTLLIVWMSSFQFLNTFLQWIMFPGRWFSGKKRQKSSV